MGLILLVVVQPQLCMVCSGSDTTSGILILERDQSFSPVNEQCCLLYNKEWGSHQGTVAARHQSALRELRTGSGAACCLALNRLTLNRCSGAPEGARKGKELDIGLHSGGAYQRSDFSASSRM